MTTHAQGERVPEWTVGDRLRKARETLEMDQTEFANHIGVSRGTVSNYERDLGERRRRIVLNAWAAATGVPIEWLESGAAPSPTPTPPGKPSELERLTRAKRSRTRTTGEDATTRRYLQPAMAAA